MHWSIRGIHRRGMNLSGHAREQGRRSSHACMLYKHACMHACMLKHACMHMHARLYSMHAWEKGEHACMHAWREV